ncbi:iron complex transport system permease protein [Quadrisphaera granulorum]|uniref:Iron complex transport system permease protein n=1 Tax=Quadrisphaera granulorum TaxID=317664 RepID=A0A316B1Q7_9ACTN|nr:iron chelate uptake ABC transporter family permease subunit [Quadrisphaera granulorum]PWJ56497.1 iron complex transport system permease protein [Quadrisphaera granulorum]SZE95131.1 iron complex transport system permease protein [Quadrisphaera granulorum]
MTATAGTRRRRALRVGPVSFPVRARVTSCYLAVAVVVLVLFCLTVSIGEKAVPLRDVAAVLLGGGSPGDRFIVGELRLPRALVALGAGLALGASGALVQSVTRNPLASPDVIGILSGASTGAVAAIVLGATTAGGVLGVWGATPFAVVGGLVAAAAVVLLSWQGEVGGMRLVLVGIGVAAISTALTSLLLVGARVHEAAQAVVWLTGTLDGRTWTHAWPLLVTVAVVLPLLAPLQHPLAAMALGDAVAQGVGVRPGAVRFSAVGGATVLAAVAVAAAGPIAFVAFVAPQVMMRVIGSATPPVLGGGLAGAFLLLATDTATRTLLPVVLPVGIVTVALGAPCFLALLLARRRLLAS